VSLARPLWLDPLVEASADVRAEDITRFLAPPDSAPRESAVLIALADDGTGPAVLLIERAATLRTHAGQTAFPGGAADAEDDGPAATALRESAEEVGLDPESVDVVTVLPALFLPASSFLVVPVLAWWHHPHPVGAVDTNEVAQAVVVPIAELADPANRFRVTHPSGFTGPGFQAGGMFVWGFTAGLLSFLIKLGGWERPWDESRMRALPGFIPAAGTVEP
jgi:8-oxo-dGTP pyrophosphatase MutT (NUDIX family)